MENNEYSKFRELNYTKDYDFEEFWEANEYTKDIFEEFWEKNEHTKDIFENSRLFAQSYKKFNDIDECVYLVDKSISEYLINKIYNEKQEKVICCFSSRKIIGTDGEELMWAHYANGSKGIRIDFSIDYEKFAEVEGYVKEVEYRQKNQFNNSNDLEKELNENKLQNIICRKSEAWKYEQEHRAIFTKGDNNYLSIKIERITFGRGCGFFPNKKLNNPESEQENAWKHILKIASFIYKVMKESNKNKGVMPKFYYYQDKYSLEPVEIPKEKLDSELERVTKLQDEIQLLEQKIVDLKKEINNPTIRSEQTPTESLL